MIGALVVVAVLVACGIGGLIFRRRDGRVRKTDEQQTPLAEYLRGRLGSNATVVQFSSAFCQPCRATRRVLEEVTVMVPGVSHVEIDAEENLELVRALDVRRTPTVLFLGPSGEVHHRASGQPRKVDVIAALGRVMDASGDVSS
ncbi:MAG: thioredoxin family protein [Candidatus Nanopelagicales bacterium]|nr:thioredoxin family protein [Candidatus Nanopelagicales bacterium]